MQAACCTACTPSPFFFITPSARLYNINRLYNNFNYLFRIYYIPNIMLLLLCFYVSKLYIILQYYMKLIISRTSSFIIILSTNRDFGNVVVEKYYVERIVVQRRKNVARLLRRVRARTATADETTTSQSKYLSNGLRVPPLRRRCIRYNVRAHVHTIF